MMAAEAQVDADLNPITIQAIEPQQIREVWPSVKQFAKDALRHAFDDMTARDLLEMILLGELLLVVIKQDQQTLGIAAFEISGSSKGDYLHCMIFAGDDMSTWVDQFMALWHMLARHYGCRWISIKGRKGWDRYASKRYGFEHCYTVMRKEVD